VCFDPVTGVALSLHPGLCSASPSGLLLSSNHALLCIEKREEIVQLRGTLRLRGESAVGRLLLRYNLIGRG
ncbi:MAG: hypothetical protein IJ160_04385, partial [Muribaculaceae bacterium]|nr:hypothetical protein [Muribaculaceae bacterium]